MANVDTGMFQFDYDSTCGIASEYDAPPKAPRDIHHLDELSTIRLSSSGVLIATVSARTLSQPWDLDDVDAWFARRSTLDISADSIEAEWYMPSLFNFVAGTGSMLDTPSRHYSFNFERYDRFTQKNYSYYSHYVYAIRNQVLYSIETNIAADKAAFVDTCIVDIEASLELREPASSSASSLNADSQDASSSQASSSSSQLKKAELPFRDISASSSYLPAIAWAKDHGILQGYPDGTFQPDRTVNRAEFLKILFAAQGTEASSEAGSISFKDVHADAWFAPYVHAAKEAGIIQGYADGTFKPEQTVNVAEALKMAYGALRVETIDAGGAWYERFLRHAREHAIVATSDLQPEDGMLRQDAVWMVWMLQQ